ncbi:restriction endonuclease [Pusillimonas noertemannii]|uniref:Restriction endonuclease n=1 Tax=Pusillimonas noertemannii TaxID=305977 RepID=A0A2U1CNY9_9BURK|nr:restriction endonuclease [Pusillimonas noertemannii]NYT68266.1 restriction endonuclease [Pusillimonas noertemannii]PVY62719.1 restriction endonuclease [Pusillimonas noertemannii]TFL10345.1 restriction endonuclease [Pusillimonas noertemannii]
MDIEHRIYLKDIVKTLSERQLQHDALRAELQELVRKHLPTLSRKKQQKLIHDDYGQARDTEWIKELSYFIANVLKYDNDFVDYLPTFKETILREINDSIVNARSLSNAVRAAINRDLKQHQAAFLVPLFERPLSVIIWQMVDQYEDEQKSRTPTGGKPQPIVNNGHDYEHACCDILAALGWSVVHRGHSGDQGVDLIGELNGNRVAFQCKFYSSPVGNAAVQEVIAGMTYEGISTGAVITNSSFTIAARQLANTAEVVLLHHDQLADFTALVLDSVSTG